MKKISVIILVFLLTSFIFAKTAVKSLPPTDLHVTTQYNGAQLSWKYQSPDTVISYNSDYPLGFWTPVKKQALGVVFDLSLFQGATLEQIDFAHYGRTQLAGPYWYNVHIYDIDSSKIVAVIDSLVAGDAFDKPRFEIGVKLGSIPAPRHAGIFIEGLSTKVINDREYSFPALMSDTSAYVHGVNYYCADAYDPFYASDPDYSNLIESYDVDHGATNYVLDLWINYNGHSTLAKPRAVTKRQVLSSVAVPPNTEGQGWLNKNVHIAKPLKTSPQEFNIFKGDSVGNLSKIATVPGDRFYYTDSTVQADSSYYFGVTAVCNSQISPITTVQYIHPRTLSLAEARADINGDYVPDLLDQEIYLKGLVNSVNFSSHCQYYLQDARAGLQLYSSSLSLSLQIGDSVFVHGFVKQYKGLTEIVPDSAEEVTVFSSGNKVDTLKITINHIGENMEGRLIELAGVSIVNPGEWPSEGANGYDVYITDGTQTAKLFIDKDTDLDGWSPPAGPMNLVGIVDQYTGSAPANDGYSVRPRFQTDLIPLTALGKGNVQAATAFALKQNYPNPFNPSTAIGWRLAVDSNVELAVYNALGQKVRILVNEKQDAGVHHVKFDGRGLPSGVYFYRLKAGSFEQVRKMLLLR